MSVGGELLFVLAGLGALVTAALTISVRNPLRAAVSLLVHIGCLAALYLSLHAHLLAAVQLLVYAGAVVVLFIFVIMLIGPTALTQGDSGRALFARAAGASLMAMVGAVLVFTVAGIDRQYVDLDQCAPGVAECGQFGGVKAMAHVVYSVAAVPFELLSVLLLVAILAAVAVARGHSPQEKRELENTPRT